MTDIASLRMAIETGDVRRASAELDRLERAAGRNTSAASGLTGAYSKLGGVLAGVSFVASGREAIKLADTYASMTARLSLVTRGTAELTRIQRELFTVAQQTRVGLEETASLYGALARNAEQLGVSQNEVIGVTRTINQALTVSGTSAAGAAAALVQLNQAFASGVLRGEELNSVLEQAPALARAIADGLGVPIGQLRKLGEEGKLTADRVFAALQRSAGDIQRAFEKMPLTVGQATTQAGNSVLQLIGQIDRLTGVTGSIASFASGSATRIDSLAEAFRRAKDEGRGLLDVIADRFSGKLAGTESVQEMRDRVKELEDAMAGGWLARFFGVANQADGAKLREYRVELERLKAALAPPNDGSYDALEQRRLRGLPAPASTDKPGKRGAVADPFRDEAKALRERLALVGANTEAERVLTEIALGKFGRLTVQQRAELQALAEAIDTREAHTRALEGEAAVREAAGRLSQAALASVESETRQLIAGNQALRDEIELLGADENAKAAIERARVSSARALLEERAAILANVEGTEVEVQLLRQQIELLRQREDLLTQRQDRQNFFRPVDEGDMPKKAGADTYTEVRGALSAAFRDTQNPIRAFASALGNAVFTRVTSSLADAMAMQLVGSTGTGGLFGNLLGAAGNLFGGGVPVGNGTGATGDFARFDRGLATGTNYVPYDGMKATLHEGEAVIPKRYNPAAGGSPMGGTRVALTYAPNVRIDARADQAQVQQLVAQANAEGQRQMLKRLSDMGVL